MPSASPGLDAGVFSPLASATAPSTQFSPPSAGQTQIYSLDAGNPQTVADANISTVDTTIAGNSKAIAKPMDVAADTAGNLYIADYANNRIVKVDAQTGQASVFAGGNFYGGKGDGGPAINAQLYFPEGVAVDKDGNVYIADTYNNRIRKVDSNGIITTVAGSDSKPAGFSGDGGLATDAQLNSPRGVAVDDAGNLYIADFANNRIRMVDTNGTITTIAGNGSKVFSGDGGPATDASLLGPQRVAVSNNHLYIADTNHYRVRMVDLASHTISTVVGNGFYGSTGDGGPATDAEINTPIGLTLHFPGKS